MAKNMTRKLCWELWHPGYISAERDCLEGNNRMRVMAVKTPTLDCLKFAGYFSPRLAMATEGCFDFDCCQVMQHDLAFDESVA